MIRRQAIVLLALVGLLIATYLWLYKIGVLGELKCGTGSCEYVQTSPYAALLGVPVAFIGVVGYVAVFIVGLAGVQPRFQDDRRVATLLAVLATIGFGFTLYLTAVELLVLHAICRWCVGSAIIMTAIWALALADVIRAPSAATPLR